MLYQAPQYQNGNDTWFIIPLYHEIVQHETSTWGKSASSALANFPRVTRQPKPHVPTWSSSLTAQLLLGSGLVWSEGPHITCTRVWGLIAGSIEWCDSKEVVFGRGRGSNKDREWRWRSSVSCLVHCTGWVMVVQDHVMNCICNICLKLRAELSIEFGSSWKKKEKLHLISTVYCQSISVLEGDGLEKTQNANRL